jgi:hypothetical protein
MMPAVAPPLSDESGMRDKAAGDPITTVAVLVESAVPTVCTKLLVVDGAVSVRAPADESLR